MLRVQISYKDFLLTNKNQIKLIMKRITNTLNSVNKFKLCVILLPILLIIYPVLGLKTNSLANDPIFTTTNSSDIISIENFFNTLKKLCPENYNQIDRYITVVGILSDSNDIVYEYIDNINNPSTEIQRIISDKRHPITSNIRNIHFEDQSKTDVNDVQRDGFYVVKPYCIEFNPGDTYWSKIIFTEVNSPFLKGVGINLFKVGNEYEFRFAQQGRFFNYSNNEFEFQTKIEKYPGILKKMMKPFWSLEYITKSIPPISTYEDDDYKILKWKSRNSDFENISSAKTVFYTVNFTYKYRFGWWEFIGYLIAFFFSLLIGIYVENRYELLKKIRNKKKFN